MWLFRILWFFCSVKVKVIPTYLYEKSVFGYFRSIFSSGKLVTRWFVDRRECCCQRPRSRFIRELINSDKSENESGKYTQHTVRKSQIMSKNSIFRKNDKIVNLNFCAKNQWISVIFKHWYLLEFEFSREKNGKIQLFSIFGNSVFPQNHDFWRENSNYPVNFPLKNSKKSWLSSLKIQIQNLEFFWKIEFLDIIWNFLTLCWGCDVEAAEAAEAVKACSWGWW